MAPQLPLLQTGNGLEYRPVHCCPPFTRDILAIMSAHLRPVQCFRYSGNFVLAARGTVCARRVTGERYGPASTGALHRHAWVHRAIVRPLLSVWLLVYAR